MCGIAGKLEMRLSALVEPETVNRMTLALRHRGPDDHGIWVDGHVGLGSRRLAIIDLSARARQPMTNEDGSLRIVFNGEIYNFQHLRAYLERKGHKFWSNSDTETVLHLYEEESVDCLKRLRGMFAFALWDSRRQTLFLARDRLGKKPLFYYHDEQCFIFGSEPKAILQDPRVCAEPNPEAIHHFLTYGYVPSPLSAFRRIHKLPAAHYLLVRNGQLSLHRYWSLRYLPKRTGSESSLGEELLTLLENAVRLRLISDVPLGVLLSGGLDSSAMVAIVRRLVSGPVRTFSIGFDEPQYDELRYARQVAERFETDHQELVVKPDVVNLLPRLVWHYDEPFGDSSALPSFALCGMARQFVTVALNGDGGDEDFLGYDRYRAVVLAHWYDCLPDLLRRGLLAAGSLVPVGPTRSRRQRLRRFTAALALDPRRRYGSWLTVFSNASKAELYTPEFAEHCNGLDSLSILEAACAASDAPSFLEMSVHSDVQLYLPDDLLVKMDIASMAH